MAGGTAAQRRIAAAIAIAALAGFLLSSCSSSPAAHAPTGTTGTNSGTTDASGLDWVVTRTALADIARDPLALAVLEQGHIYEIVGISGKPLRGVTAIVTADFKSFTGPTGMAQEVTDGNVPAGTKALLYDPEYWAQTPAAEQQHLSQYVTLAIGLAHSHGYQLIVTPGVDLTKVVDPTTASTDGRYEAFLDSGIDAAVKGADIVDIQAQGDERDASDYASFVKAAAAQIHSSSPSSVVIAGLSTNPPVGSVTSPELVDAIEAVAGVVKGFWLNIPTGHSSSCPGCGSAQPALATEALTTAFP
jgi:hypothetical protein